MVEKTKKFTEKELSEILSNYLGLDEKEAESRRFGFYGRYDKETRRFVTTADLDWTDTKETLAEEKALYEKLKLKFGEE